MSHSDSDTNPTQEYLTTQQAAALCGFTAAAFYQRQVRGNGPPVIKLGVRCVRYKRADVLSWLDQHTARGTEGRPL